MNLNCNQLKLHRVCLSFAAKNAMPPNRNAVIRIYKVNKDDDFQSDVNWKSIEKRSLNLTSPQSRVQRNNKRQSPILQRIQSGLIIINQSICNSEQKTVETTPTPVYLPNLIINEYFKHKTQPQTRGRNGRVVFFCKKIIRISKSRSGGLARTWGARDMPQIWHPLLTTGNKLDAQTLATTGGKEFEILAPRAPAHPLLRHFQDPTRV